MPLTEGEKTQFDDYMKLVQMAPSLRPNAIETYEWVLRDHLHLESCYRVMSALDYLMGAYEVRNAYLRFIVLVCTAERLYSHESEGDKGDKLAMRMTAHLSGERRVTRRRIVKDYKTRSRLVHGQGLPQVPSDQVKRLCDVWFDWNGEALRYLLLNRKEIEGLLPDRRWT